MSDVLSNNVSNSSLLKTENRPACEIINTIPVDKQTQDHKVERQVNTEIFIKSPEQPNEENDGEFSAKVALKNFFFVGIKDTLKQIVTHPAETILAVGAVVALSAFCPLLIPVMSYVGVALGGFEVLNGARKAIECYRKNDMDGLEDSFKELGSGTFTLATSGIIKNPLQRFLKLSGKITKHLTHETAHWYKKVYFPQLKKLDPLAVGFGVFNVVEGIHIGHSILTLNPIGVVTGLALFLGVKYLYMGIHYRKEVKQGINLVRKHGHILLKDKTVRKEAVNGFSQVLKEFLLEFKLYVFKGQKSEPLSLFAELNLKNNSEIAAMNVSAMCKLPQAFTPLMNKTRARDILSMFVEWSTTKNKQRKLGLEKKFLELADIIKMRLSKHCGEEIARQVVSNHNSPVELVLNHLPLGLV